MIELGGRAGFPEKPLQPLLVVRKSRRQDFDRDLAFQIGIVGQPDLPHGSCPESPLHEVRSDPGGWAGVRRGTDGGR
jgi:hypothetical protein